jgi:arsenate reductase
MKKKKVLFVCVHNSARSQMAEAFLNRLGGDRFRAESAGLTPGTMNPVAVEVMAEAGYDISGASIDSVFDFYREGRLYQYVISVCDESRAQACPVFPGISKRLHWSFPDPAGFSGSPEEVLRQTRRVRDKIQKKIKEFIYTETDG